MFATPMRERRCMTVLDPFHQKYGKTLTAGMSLVSLCLDIFWIPATLTGLGLLFTFISVYNCSWKQNMDIICDSKQNYSK